MNDYKLPDAKKYVIDNYSDKIIIDKIDKLYLDFYTKNKN